jgi:hypothetical protein
VHDLTADVVRTLSLGELAAYANPTVMATKAGKMFSNLGNAMGAITDGRGDATQYMLGCAGSARPKPTF